MLLQLLLSLSSSLAVVIAVEADEVAAALLLPKTDCPTFAMRDRRRALGSVPSVLGVVVGVMVVVLVAAKERVAQSALSQESLLAALAAASNNAVPTKVEH